MIKPEFYFLTHFVLFHRINRPLTTPSLSINGAQVCLNYVDLAFAEDIRVFDFPPLPVSSSSGQPEGVVATGRPNADQLEAMNAFVDCMLLGDPEEDKSDDGEEGESEERALPER